MWFIEAALHNVSYWIVVGTSNRTRNEKTWKIPRILWSSEYICGVLDGSILYDGVLRVLAVWWGDSGYHYPQHIFLCVRNHVLLLRGVQIEHFFSLNIIKIKLVCIKVKSHAILICYGFFQQSFTTLVKCKPKTKI